MYSVKKIPILLLAVLCMLMTGCSNEYAKTEYDSDKKIAAEGDRYSKNKSLFNTSDGEYSLTVAQYDGRETLWTDWTDKDQDVGIKLSLSLSKGRAKVVYVDDEGNITTIIECSPEDCTDGYITKNLSLKKGKNRIKIVGYDCRNIDLKFSFQNME